MKYLRLLWRLLTEHCYKCGGAVEIYSWKKAYCLSCGAKN